MHASLNNVGMTCTKVAFGPGGPSRPKDDALDLLWMASVLSDSLAVSNRSNPQESHRLAVLGIKA